MSVCRICKNLSGNKTHTAREMMLGLRDEFEYSECSRCGCLQINQIPEDLPRYYSNGYYSLQPPELNANMLHTFLKRQRARYGLYGRGILGRVLLKRYPLPDHYEWFKKGRVGFKSRILDVGCGRGWHLLKIKEEGFSDLTGIDPFIAEDIFYKNGVRIFKRELKDIKEQFDFVMFNHSFEHMSEPLSVFKELHRIMKPDSYTVIRIPVASCFAWRTYGVDWVQLDAPREPSAT